MHPPVAQRENCFSSSSTTYLFSGLSERSIDRSILTQASNFFRFVTPELLLLLLQAKFLANTCLIQSSISAVIHFQIYRISHLTPRDLQVFSDASIPRRNAKIVALQVKRSIDFAADSPFFQFVTPELLLLLLKGKFLANL
jgi:hypothetical protein